MPHNASFFRQQLTFSTHSDFPVTSLAEADTVMDVYLFNGNNLDSEQIETLAENYLHPEEQVVFKKRKQQQAQQEYLASRLLIKGYASKSLGYDLTSLHVLFDNKDNCLHVYHKNNIIPLRCCISHSHGHVLIALATTDQPVKLGIDLEWISTKRSLDRVANHYYHPEELQACLKHTESASENLAKAVHQSALYRIWTLKEALAKAIKQPIAKLIRDNVFEHTQQLNVQSGSYQSADVKCVKGDNKTFDISIISNINITDNTQTSTNVKVLTGRLDQDFRNVK